MSNVMESLKRKADAITTDLFPVKSRVRCNAEYKIFLNWLSIEMLEPCVVSD